MQISKPREYNRAYDRDTLNAVLADKSLCSYIENLKCRLLKKPVIETGWTSYHLMPVFHHAFGAAFQYVILHRDPVSTALSRANMGNYHRRSFYDRSHEVSPLDKRSISPDKAELWPSMNHVERCLYWWYVVYLEAFEFAEKRPDVSHRVVSAQRLFSGDGIREVCEFAGFTGINLSGHTHEKNEVHPFMRETFPIRDEWKSIDRHREILDFAASLGYTVDFKSISEKALKYRLPSGILPFVRHRLGYWRLRRRMRAIACGCRLTAERRLQ